MVQCYFIVLTITLMICPWQDFLSINFIAFLPVVLLSFICRFYFENGFQQVKAEYTDFKAKKERHTRFSGMPFLSVVDCTFYKSTIKSNCILLCHAHVFCKKGVLKNFAKLTGKQLCQSLFKNKVAGVKSATLF